MKRKGMFIMVLAMAVSILFAGSLFAKEKTKVAIVFATGGLGDKSFNDSAMEGIKQAIKNMVLIMILSNRKQLQNIIRI